MNSILAALVLATGSGNYTTRDSATELLRVLYPLSVPACIQGSRSLDPEVQARCLRVLAPLPRHVAHWTALTYLLQPKELELSPRTHWIEEQPPTNKWLVVKAAERWSRTYLCWMDEEDGGTLAYLNELRSCLWGQSNWRWMP